MTVAEQMPNLAENTNENSNYEKSNKTLLGDLGLLISQGELRLDSSQTQIFFDSKNEDLQLKFAAVKPSEHIHSETLDLAEGQDLYSSLDARYEQGKRILMPIIAKDKRGKQYPLIVERSDKGFTIHSEQNEVPVMDTLILGGGPAGYFLANELKNKGIQSVGMIDRMDGKRPEHIAVTTYAATIFEKHIPNIKDLISKFNVEVSMYVLGVKFPFKVKQVGNQEKMSIVNPQILIDDLAAQTGLNETNPNFINAKVTSLLQWNDQALAVQNSTAAGTRLASGRVIVDCTRGNLESQIPSNQLEITKPTEELKYKTHAVVARGEPDPDKSEYDVFRVNDLQLGEIAISDRPDGNLYMFWSISDQNMADFKARLESGKTKALTAEELQSKPGLYEFISGLREKNGSSATVIAFEQAVFNSWEVFQKIISDQKINSQDKQFNPWPLSSQLAIPTTGNLITLGNSAMSINNYMGSGTQNAAIAAEKAADCIKQFLDSGYWDESIEPYKDFLRAEFENKGIQSMIVVKVILGLAVDLGKIVPAKFTKLALQGILAVIGQKGRDKLGSSLGRWYSNELDIKQLAAEITKIPLLRPLQKLMVYQVKKAMKDQLRSLRTETK